MRFKAEGLLPNDAVCTTTHWLNGRNILRGDLEKTTKYVILQVSPTVGWDSFVFNHHWFILHSSVSFFCVWRNREEEEKGGVYILSKLEKQSKERFFYYTLMLLRGKEMWATLGWIHHPCFWIIFEFYYYYFSLLNFQIWMAVGSRAKMCRRKILCTMFDLKENFEVRNWGERGNKIGTESADKIIIKKYLKWVKKKLFLFFT